MENNRGGVTKGVKLIFGIFMILIYLGMGVLLLINFFQWEWAWARIGLGVLFIIYGFWRGYREFKR